MTKRVEAMDARRLEALLDAYGADPARWPAAERAAAQALLETNPALQTRLEEARRLDRALDRLPPTPAPSGELVARIRAAARSSGRQQGTIPAAPQAPANSNRPAWRFPAALAASAALGLWLGFAAGPFTTLESGGTIDLAALDQQDIAVLAFGPIADAQNAAGGSFYD